MGVWLEMALFSKWLGSWWNHRIASGVFSCSARPSEVCEEGGLLHSRRLRFVPGGCKYRGTKELRVWAKVIKMMALGI